MLRIFYQTPVSIAVFTGFLLIRKSASHSINRDRVQIFTDAASGLFGEISFIHYFLVQIDSQGDRRVIISSFDFDSIFFVIVVYHHEI